MEIITNEIFKKPSCKFKFLAKEGFNIPNFYEVSSTVEVTNIYTVYITEKRDLLSYDIDGLVEEVNDYESQSKLGFEPNGLIPKFATAIKFDSVSAITKLVNIDWTCGATGKVLPRAWFEPVEIMGVTIQKATLHNYDFMDNLIKNQGLCIGSDVVLTRANDVIPKVLGVKSSNVSEGKKIEIIDICPSCGEKLEKFSVDLVCENLKCPAKVKGLFSNYFETLNIKGVSDKFIEKAMEVYNISSLPDLLDLSLAQIESLPGFAKKSAKLAFDAIHSVKDITPEQFMALLNIPNQGVRVFENLLSNIPLETLLDDNFDPSDMINVNGIAEKTARAIFEGIQTNLDNIRKNATYFNVKTKKVEIKDLLKGQTFCITGKLYSGTRSEIENKIKQSGGQIKSVNNKLNFLVTNDSDTSSDKMNKVLEINTKQGTELIKIITEKDLLEMLGGE